MVGSRWSRDQQGQTVSYSALEAARWHAQVGLGTHQGKLSLTLGQKWPHGRHLMVWEPRRVTCHSFCTTSGHMADSDVLGTCQGDLSLTQCQKQPNSRLRWSRNSAWENSVERLQMFWDHAKATCHSLYSTNGQMVGSRWSGTCRGNLSLNLQ